MGATSARSFSRASQYRCLRANDEYRSETDRGEFWGRGGRGGKGVEKMLALRRGARGRGIGNGGIDRGRVMRQYRFSWELL